MAKPYKGEREPYNPVKERYVSCKLRIQIFRRDGFRCVLCGASPERDPEVELQIDHIVPVSKGGKSVPENLQSLCRECNIGKQSLILKPPGYEKSR